MFGVVCTNPVTGCVEPWTIAGPTDGSTNIVHHDENRDYQLATANDSQYGASYLGITECCKPLYNPSTGNLTVDCATTTATGVDVNADDNVDVAHPIIAQNYDCDDAEFKDKLIKASCFNYNPQCYVCNDPVTGNPVRKPVVHIGTLCADEYLGFTEGLPRRARVCEDCWRQIPFIGEDNGKETLDTTWDCDAFRHNSCTCTTAMVHLEISDICQPGDNYIGNRAFNPNTFEYYTKDPTNTSNKRYVGFTSISMNAGFSVYDCDTTNSCYRYRLSLSESNSAIDTNSLTISPTSCPSLCLNLNYIPLTANTESSNYELVGLNVSNNQLKKLDGFSYNPTTCYLCGNFCGNINIFPYEYNWTGNTGKTCLKVDDYGFNVTNYCGANASTWLTVSNDYVVACSCCGSLSLGSGNNGARLLSCTDAFVASCNCLHLTSQHDMFITSVCNNICIKTCRTSDRYSFTGESSFKRCSDSGINSELFQSPITICYALRNGTCNISTHAISCSDTGRINRLAVCCDANVGWQAYALMCDISAVSPIKSISCCIANPGDYTVACFISDTCEAGIYSIDLYNNNLCWTITDQIGCSRTLKGLTGILTMPTNGGFGHFSGSACGDFMIDMNVSAGRGALENIVIAPIPGTMYGTASVNGINVEGTV